MSPVHCNEGEGERIKERDAIRGVVWNINRKGKLRRDRNNFIMCTSTEKDI